MRDTGIPLFHYSFEGTKRVDVIVAAFLSAIGSFAQEASDQQLRVISFSKNKFIWVQRGDIYFIALVALEDSTEIYYVILQEIANQFVGQYYDSLRQIDNDGSGVLVHKFEDFSDTIEMILRRFDGIPGLARRHKRALLPSRLATKLKKALMSVEDEVLLRGAAITNDGYIIVTNLRVYEIDAVMQMMTVILAQSGECDHPMKIGHEALDPKTTFVVCKLPKYICAFVCEVGHDEEYHARMAPFIKVLEETQNIEPRRLNLEASGRYAAFHDLDLVVTVSDTSEVIDNARVHFSGLDSTLRKNALTVLKSLSQETTVGDIIDSTGLGKDQIVEALAVLVARGIIQVNRVYPQLGIRDERFNAYLEIIGMPKRDYVVLDQIWNYCNGTTSIMEIAQQTGIPTSRIMEVLKKLGNHVTWNTENDLLSYD